jgi:hypothetical protein
MAEFVCQYARQLIDVVEHEKKIGKDEYVPPRCGEGIDDVFFYHVKTEGKIRHLNMTADMGTELIDISGEVRIIGKIILGSYAEKKLIPEFDFFLRAQGCLEGSWS